MKHLLIIFSFLLLLSSPLFGQETGVLYQYETSTGIQWKTFGDVKVPPEYEGEIRNGKPDGFGILIRFDGKKYVGEWKDGMRSGQGTETWSSGWKYVGEWREGKPWNITIYGKSGIIILKYIVDPINETMC